MYSAEVRHPNSMWGNCFLRIFAIVPEQLFTLHLSTHNSLFVCALSVKPIRNWSWFGSPPLRTNWLMSKGIGRNNRSGRNRFHSFCRCGYVDLVAIFIRLHRVIALAGTPGMESSVHARDTASPFTEKRTSAPLVPDRVRLSDWREGCVKVDYRCVAASRIAV